MTIRAHRPAVFGQPSDLAPPPPPLPAAPPTAQPHSPGGQSVEPHGQREPPVAVIDSTRHRSIPWIDTTRPTLPRYPQPRAPRTAGHHGAGRDSGTGANQSPTTVSRRVCGRVQRRAPGASGQDRATLDHGQGTHYTIDRLSNTRPAPPTTGSSSMDQGVGRSVWVPYSSGKRARPRTCHNSVTRTGKQEDS
jgi:hypothetical protein